VWAEAHTLASRRIGSLWELKVVGLGGIITRGWSDGGGTRASRGPSGPCGPSGPGGSGGPGGPGGAGAWSLLSLEGL